MVILTICVLAVGAQKGHAKEAEKPLGPASRIFVAPIPLGAGMSDADAVRYLNRHAIPAGLLASLRPIRGTSKVNDLISMNAVLVVDTSPRFMLSVFMFKPALKPDLKQGHPVWTLLPAAGDAKALAVGLEELAAKWHKDHGLRIRKE